MLGLTPFGNLSLSEEISPGNDKNWKINLGPLRQVLWKNDHPITQTCLWMSHSLHDLTSPTTPSLHLPSLSYPLKICMHIPESAKKWGWGGTTKVKQLEIVPGNPSQQHLTSTRAAQVSLHHQRFCGLCSTTLDIMNIDSCWTSRS